MTQAVNNSCVDVQTDNQDAIDTLKSVIPNSKWTDYITEWSEAEYENEERVEIVTETDEWVVLDFGHSTDWFNYYDLGLAEKGVMYDVADSVTDRDVYGYPVVLPKVTTNE